MQLHPRHTEMAPSLPTDPTQPFVPMPREYWLALWKEEIARNRQYTLDMEPVPDQPPAISPKPNPNPPALSEQYVRDIRKLWHDGATYNSIARVYNCSPATVRNIILGNTYWWVADEAVAS